MPQLFYPVCDDHAAQKPGKIKQFVVVIFIRLKTDQFSGENNRNRSAEYSSLLRIFVKQGKKECDKRQSDIFDIKPIDFLNDFGYIFFDSNKKNN